MNWSERARSVKREFDKLIEERPLTGACCGGDCASAGLEIEAKKWDEENPLKKCEPCEGTGYSSRDMHPWNWTVCGKCHGIGESRG